MTPFEQPSNNGYSIPRDFPQEKMHYAAVQISKHRYVVVKYAGTTTRLYGELPTFVTVSKPMSFLEAAELAQKFTLERIQPKTQG